MRVNTLIDNISYIEAVGIEDIVEDIQGIAYNSKKFSTEIYLYV